MKRDRTPGLFPEPPDDVPIYKSMGDVGYEGGSETSREAAESISPEALARMERVVYDALQASQDGLTDEQLEGLTGLSHQSASARRRGLVLRGMVQDSGKRRQNASGKAATVWTVRE